MMNEEIKALIEREAEKYIDNCPEVENNDCSWQTIDRVFKDGINTAFSIFRWRKVSEELPEEDVWVLIKYGSLSVGKYFSYKERFVTTHGNVIYPIANFEWMPIPQ